MSTSKETNGAISPERSVDDRELMRWLDGELDEEASAELEARFDDEAWDKLEGLDQVGELLRELVDEDERGDAIVDAVMERIDAEGEVAVPIEREPAVKAAPAANDNARNIYAFAAAAAAVAAGLFFWSKTEPEPVAQAPAPPTIEAPAATPAPAPTADESLAEAEPAAEDEDAPGVEIAAVDFGSQSGSVFYISGGDSAATSTAVVWVTDPGD